jgi:hypothetical protein
MIGYSSDVVNGQLIHIAPKQGYAPLTFGQAYSGPRFDSSQAVYNVPPVVPNTSMGGGIGSVAGQTVGTPLPTAGGLKGNGGVNFFHPTKSPLPMALIFLIGGLLMLKYIHFGGK